MKIDCFKFLLSVIFIFPFSQITAQKVLIKEVHEKDPTTQNGKYVFPLITVPGNPQVSKKINWVLQTTFLDLDSSLKVRKSIFENVQSNRESPGPTRSDFSYEVLSNSANVFSISISAEACGAYCEDYTEYYCFDVKTGTQLTLNDLLTEIGKKRMLDSINGRKKAILTKKIAAIRDTISRTIKWQNADDSEYYSDMLQLYVDCMSADRDSNLDFARFYLSENSFFVGLDRCSAHVNRNLDEIGEFQFYFDNKYWKQFFSAYGKLLIK